LKPVGDDISLTVSTTGVISILPRRLRNTFDKCRSTGILLQFSSAVGTCYLHIKKNPNTDILILQTPKHHLQTTQPVVIIYLSFILYSQQRKQNLQEKQIQQPSTSRQQQDVLTAATIQAAV